MKKEKIYWEGNVAIAKYMGAKEDGGSSVGIDNKMCNSYVVEVVMPDGFKEEVVFYDKLTSNGIWNPTVLRYHKDYNHLIPVAKELLKELKKKGKGEKPVGWHNVNTSIPGAIGSSLLHLEYALEELNIKQIWEAVIEGIGVLKNIHV